VDLLLSSPVIRDLPLLFVLSFHEGIFIAVGQYVSVITSVRGEARLTSYLRVDLHLLRADNSEMQIHEPTLHIAIRLI
jgi:hypothetical protein